jgi:hypothetical protein
MAVSPRGDVACKTAIAMAAQSHGHKAGDAILNLAHGLHETARAAGVSRFAALWS